MNNERQYHWRKRRSLQRKRPARLYFLRTKIVSLITAQSLGLDLSALLRDVELYIYIYIYIYLRTRSTTGGMHYESDIEKA